MILEGGHAMRRRAFLGPGRSFRVVAQGVFLTLFGLAGPVEDAHPQDASSRTVCGPDAGRASVVPDEVEFEEGPMATGAGGPGDGEGAGGPRVEMGTVTIRTETPAVAGARMVLN